MNHRAFTLIELLIVISVLAMLAGMAMPMIGLARRSAEKTNTRAMLGIVNNAVGAFKQDVGCFPYRNPATDADLVGNDLAWRLWRPMQASERTQLDQALTEIEGRFLVSASASAKDPANLWTNGIATWAADAFTAREVATCSPETTNATLASYNSSSATYGVLVNRLATLRAQSAVLSGFIRVARNSTATTPILANPGAIRGFGDDFLGGNLQPRHRDGDAIVDVWKRPLGYVCPVVHGGRRTVVGQPISGSDYTSLGFVDPRPYGLAPTLRTVTTSRDSNIRTHASQAWIARPELWSCSTDGVSSARRDANLNIDDLLAESYLKGLQ